MKVVLLRTQYVLTLVECYNGTGFNYRGIANRTRSGLKCQSWNAQWPHQHGNTQSKKPGLGLGDHNYCRNPDNEPDGPWCYTTSNLTRWEYCAVPHCGKSDKISFILYSITFELIVKEYNRSKINYQRIVAKVSVVKL